MVVLRLPGDVRLGEDCPLFVVVVEGATAAAGLFDDAKFRRGEFLGKGMDRTMSCKDRTCNTSGSLGSKTSVRIYSNGNKEV